MKRIIVPIFILCVTVLTFSGCSNNETEQDKDQPQVENETDTNTDTDIAPTATEDPSSTEDTTALLEKISAEQANDMLKESDSIILLDVRTEGEYSSGHIEGAILIPDYEITDQAPEVLDDKSATILVYCRSGNRSASAAQALQDLGYTTIYDFGGIIDWPYDVVTN